MTATMRIGGRAYDHPAGPSQARAHQSLLNGEVDAPRLPIAASLAGAQPLTVCACAAGVNKVRAHGAAVSFLMLVLPNSVVVPIARNAHALRVAAG